MEDNKIITWTLNVEGKPYIHEMEFKVPQDNRPFWAQLGHKTYEDYENSLILIDMETGKQYNFNAGKEIKDDKQS